MRSAMAVVECNDETCEHNDDGYCSASWVKILDQECMTYAYIGGYEEEEEPVTPRLKPGACNSPD